MTDNVNKLRAAVSAFRVALPLTLPVLAGFLFTGIAYGILMHSAGFGAIWTFITSYMVFAGSMQYVAITLLNEAFNPLYAFALTLMVNARHIFYGLSMLEHFKDAGKIKPYLILALCDESFSLLVSSKPPEGIDKKLFMFFVAFLNRWYWIIGSVLGAAIGSLIRFSTKGLDFALTALFAVILTDQWLHKKNRPSCIIGLVCSTICLVIFGAGGFLIPAMLIILTVFAIFSEKLMNVYFGGIDV